MNQPVCVVMPNSRIATATNLAPIFPYTEPKADTERAAPCTPELQTPLMIMARDMMVQTTMVSTNTSNMPHMP